jgi:hypothetical protein
MLTNTDVPLHLTKAIKDTLSTLHNCVKLRDQSNLRGKIRHAKRGIDDTHLMQARIRIWDYIFKSCTSQPIFIHFYRSSPYHHENQYPIS